MPDAHANFAYSTVATAPSPATTGTSLVVATGDGAKFPAAPFNATVWPASAQPTSANAEIVRVTAISTDTLTITRTQEGTTARSIGVGDQIAATITAKSLTDIESPPTTAIPTLASGGNWIIGGNASWATSTKAQLTPSAGSQDGWVSLSTPLKLDGLQFVVTAALAVDGIYVALGNPGVDTTSTNPKAWSGVLIQWETYSGATNPVNTNKSGAYTDIKHMTTSGFESAQGGWGGQTGAGIPPVVAPLTFRARKVSSGYYLFEAQWGGGMPGVSQVLPSTDTVLLGFESTTGGSYGVQYVQNLIGTTLS